MLSIQKDGVEKSKKTARTEDLMAERLVHSLKKLSRIFVTLAILRRSV